ncbi:MAG: polymer-forming cytoskeletal protein [Flavobacteriaceae bacterium]|nr:polymer-forming cytoskeletal protein [Flavobacteriaceae bacterium]
MFKDKTDTTVQSNERNIIAKNTKFVGEIESNGDFRIEGTVEGNLTTKGKVVIGKDGVVKGNIVCNSIDVEGYFSGKLNASSSLGLRSTAIINGELNVGSLSVEPGAKVNTTISMGASIVNLDNSNKKKEKIA